MTVSGHESGDKAAAAADDDKAGTTSPECNEQPSDNDAAQSPAAARLQASTPPVPGNAL